MVNNIPVLFIVTQKRRKIDIMSTQIRKSAFKVKSVKPTFTAIRTVTGLVNKLSGLLISQDESGTGAALPVNQIIMVVGALGSSSPLENEGVVTGRIALYDFKDNQPRFRFVVELNENGEPQFNLDALSKRIGGSSDMAAVNWAIGALCSKSESGMYSVRKDYTPIRNSRTAFAAERSWQSCQQMFDEMVEQQWAVESDRLQIPMVLDMMHYTPKLPEGLDASLVSEMTLTKDEYRAHTINHLMQGLAGCPGDIRTKVRSEFLYKFIAIDKMAEAAVTPFASIAEVKGWASRLPQMLEKSMGGKPEEIAAQLESIGKAIKWLNRYADECKNSEFKFIIPSRGTHLKNADSHYVSGIPMQISESFQFDGDFPHNGNDLRK